MGQSFLEQDRRVLAEPQPIFSAPEKTRKNGKISPENEIGNGKGKTRKKGLEVQTEEKKNREEKTTKKPMGSCRKSLELVKGGKWNWLGGGQRRNNRKKGAEKVRVPSTQKVGPKKKGNRVRCAKTDSGEELRAQKN